MRCLGVEVYELPGPVERVFGDVEVQDMLTLMARKMAMRTAAGSRIMAVAFSERVNGNIC